MNCLHDMITFVLNGLRVFGDAARGEYVSGSPEYREMRDEFLNDNRSARQLLAEDWKNVRRDFRAGYNKLVADYGQTTD